MLLLTLLACRTPSYDPSPVLAGLGDWAPDGVPARVWREGRTAFACAASRHARQPTLGLVDFDRPSDEVRLWIVDLAEREVQYQGRIAHGSGSGDRRATRFSDSPGSHQSSLGLYAGAEPYRGKHGRSLRLDGLEAANARARSRAIVVHGAAYADDQLAEVGRSHGCFAVDPDDVGVVVDALDGGLLLASATDPGWDSPWTADCP
jgi:hypothetical protein